MLSKLNSVEIKIQQTIGGSNKTNYYQNYLKAHKLLNDNSKLFDKYEYDWVNEMLTKWVQAYEEIIELEKRIVE